jgi:hypothetical protein
MMEWCFWRSSHHWSSYPNRRKKNDPRVVLKVAYFKSIDWFGFHFCKYHAESVKVFRQLPASERYFYEQVQDRYTKFKLWCIKGWHKEQVLASLQQFEDIELEFVVRPNSGVLVIPPAFKALNLTFYERGKREYFSGKRERGRGKGE